MIQASQKSAVAFQPIWKIMVRKAPLPQTCSQCEIHFPSINPYRMLCIEHKAWNAQSLTVPNTKAQNILSPNCRRKKTELTINTKRNKRWQTAYKLDTV